MEVTDSIVEIFKTNVSEETEAKKVLEVLLTIYPDLIINFDLEDCDNILRVCGNSFSSIQISEQLHKMDYQCKLLED